MPLHCLRDTGQDRIIVLLALHGISCLALAEVGVPFGSLLMSYYLLYTAEKLAVEAVVPMVLIPAASYHY